MDRVAELTELVRQQVADYAKGQDWRGRSYFLENAQENIYAVTFVPAPDHPQAPKLDVIILARVIGDRVVIDEDITDRPLYRELMRAGIPREQIVLAYAGEQPPEPKASQA